MRLVIGRRPAEADGGKYIRCMATSDRNGPARCRADVYRQQVRLDEGESPTAAFERVRARLFRYDIFPPALVGHLVLPAGEIRKNALVIQRFGVGGLSVESATRVADVWETTEADGVQVAGFAYVTLEGHPERGVATFEVRREHEEVFVVLTARSVPGTTLTKVAGPVVRRIQRGVTKRAVTRLAGTG